MEDYKKLVERLREEPKDSRKAVLSIYDLCVDAAYAIESLLDKLKYAEGERDVVTKRMIELEEQNAALRKQADELTKTGLVATDRANKAIAELHETRSELEAAVRGQETLQKALAEVKAERSWISVKDKLPEPDVNVLARCFYHECWQMIVCHVSKRNHGQWYTGVAGQWVAVTHWMPLPDMPEDGTV